MRPSEAASESLRQVLDALDALGVEHMCVGSLARIVYGSPRFTADFDIAVATFDRPLLEIAEGLRERGFEVEAKEPSAFGRRLLIGGPFEIDLWDARSSVARREFERRKKTEFLGRDIFVVSPEDFILRKLVNTRIRRDANDVVDALDVLTFRLDTVDLGYIREHATLHRVDGLFEEILAQARKDAADSAST